MSKLINNVSLINDLKSKGDDIFISLDVDLRNPHLAVIGSHVAIDAGFKCTTVLEIGDYIHIAPDVTIIGGPNSLLKMEHFSFIAAGTKVVCSSEDYTGKGLVGPTIPLKYREIINKPVVFEKYSGCGINCSIMPGVTIAEGSIIGAGSVVTKSTEPWMIYVGIPAKPIKARDKKNILSFSKELGYE